ncbi:hypothetical protein MASR2M39_10520 [Ignavibacteriales bacterium]
MDTIFESNAPPNVILTAFKKFNKEINLSPDIQVAEEIEIDYHDVFISFEFVALNNKNHVGNKYAYILEGFDDKWIDNGNKTEAIFTHLDPGEYIFRVIAADYNGMWKEKGATVRLIVKPPFYLTWCLNFLFYWRLGCCYILFILCD